MVPSSVLRKVWHGLFRSITSSVAGIFIVAVILSACSSQAPATATTAPAASTAAPVAAGGAATPAASAAAATTPAAVKAKGGRLVVALDQVPPTLDPHGSPSAVTFEMTSSVFETLLYLDKDRKLQPYLAESYEASSDGKTYTFKLRKDVKFTDGTPFNAESVKYNFDRIVDPAYKPGGSLSALAGYDKTEVVDEFTARVTFKSPNAPFLTYAAGGTLGMMSPTATKAQTAEQVTQVPVGSGPFKIKELVASDHATLVRNEDYNRRAPGSDHDGPAYLDEVYFKFVPEGATRATTLESGESQLIHNIPPQTLGRFEGAQGFKVDKPAYVGTPRIGAVNVKLFPTDDPAVRKAIQLATNKEAIINNSYKGVGTVAYAPLTAGTLDNSQFKTLYPYSPDQAKKTLEDAGWKAGSDGIRSKDGKRLELVINAIDTGAGIDNYIQLIQAQWREVGIDAKIKAQARAPWYEDNYKCATNIIPYFLRSGDLDGIYTVAHSSTIGTNFNFACYNNPEVDKLLTDGKAETDPQKRQQIYLNAEKKVMEDAALLPLVDELSVWGYKSTVSGLMFNGYTYPLFIDVAISK
jgi:peptide/nickel transport system substrate-binding protein